MSRELRFVVLCTALLSICQPARAASLARGADLEVSTGLGVLRTPSSISSAVAIAGQARLRLGVVQVAGFMQRARAEPDTTSSVGGSLGLWFERPRSFDVDLAVGLARHRYAHDGAGSSGDYSFGTPELTAKVAVSDRNGGPLGARIGAKLAVGWDVRTRQRRFERSAIRGLDPAGTDEGNQPAPASFISARHIGGLTILIAITVALDAEF